ncbi:uncharacterized protein LOC144919134 [Branchiostoma floridae x Branchiostoma belcheri]
MSTAIAAQDNQPPPQPPGEGGGADDTTPGEPASKPSNIVVEAFSSSGSVSNRSEEITDNVPALTEQNVAAKDRREEEEDSRAVADQWEGRRRTDTDHATDRATLGTANATNVTVRLPTVTRSNEGTPRGRAATQTAHPLTPAKARIDYLPTHSADLRALNALITRSGTRFSTRSFPAQVMRMSTIGLSRARSQPTRMGMNNYFEEQNINKTISWDKAMESRPPLQVDMDGPGPTSYRPRNKPLYETNAPSFTFGRKSPPRNGGGRTAWATPWMQSESGFTKKTNFEKTWPTPVHYPGKHEKLALVGKKQVHLPTYPQFSLGARREFLLSKKGSDFEPSPNEYNISSAKVVVLPKAPAFSATPRRGTLWEKKSDTPGPGAYSPSTGWTKPHNPAFTMIGIRGVKKHELGPHATL